MAVEESQRRLTGAMSHGELEDSRFPWMHLILLSYSSALTLAMVWMLWRGRTPSAEIPRVSEIVATDAEAIARSAETAPAVSLPPLPTENLGAIGQSIRIGELEITPVSVTIKPLTLIHSIDPNRKRRGDGSSLVLTLKLTNISQNHTFVPLERVFLRDSSAPFDRSYIETDRGGQIGLYPLAVDSEWLIQDEEFPSLMPGETAETTIGSEPVAAGKLVGEMTWRVRLRIGLYRTDVLGIRFSEAQIDRSAVD